MNSARRSLGIQILIYPYNLKCAPPLLSPALLALLGKYKPTSHPSQPPPPNPKTILLKPPKKHVTKPNMRPLCSLTSAAVVSPALQENSTTSPLSIHGFGFSKDDMETALIKAIALPLSEPEKATLAPRDDDKPHRRPMPPRDMLLAEQITHDDLPICYQNCMRKNDGKSSIHMGKVSSTAPILAEACLFPRVCPFAMSRYSLFGFFHFFSSLFTFDLLYWCLL